jgi:hypothetical protein
LWRQLEKRGVGKPRQARVAGKWKRNEQQSVTSMSESVTVPKKAKQLKSTASEWDWVDRAVWTERMLAALGNGVKGNKWFWPNAYFAQLGLFTMTQAQKLASQSR